MHAVARTSYAICGPREVIVVLDDVSDAWMPVTTRGEAELAAELWGLDLACGLIDGHGVRRTKRFCAAIRGKRRVRSAVILAQLLLGPTTARSHDSKSAL